MVFDRRPDEVFMEVTQRALEVFKSGVATVSTTIRSGDQMLGEMNDALVGGRPKFGETPTETFEAVYNMLTATLEDAREKKSAAAPSVVQKSREILAKVNAAEPAWRSGPSSMANVSDVFRMALRDLRGSNSLIRLAQGGGQVEDLEQLGKWAGDLENRIKTVQEATAPKSPAAGRRRAASQPKQLPPAANGSAEGPERPEKPVPAKRAKRDTTPKAKPQPAEVAFANAVAAEIGDPKVQQWATDYGNGKISEQQWITRLTTHVAPSRETLDDVFARAEARMVKEMNGNPGPAEG
jgi:hypothetical protein